jgi:Domain of unknown function (DUF5047)
VVWDGGRDARYQDAVCRPYTLYTRVDVEDANGTVLAKDLPIVSGGVQANLQSRVTRKLSFALAGVDYFPATPEGGIDSAGILAPYGNRVRAWGGIRYGDGSIARFPIFYGRVDRPRYDIATGAVTVSCVDLANIVTRAKFETPVNSVASNTIYEEWQRLILGAVPDATFDTPVGGQTQAQVGPLSWESDRGQACDDLAAAAGCTWWQLPDGRFTMRQQPWSLAGLTPAITIADATQNLPGQRTITSGTVSLPVDDVANVAVLSSERLDGSPPLTSIQRDVDPASPTYYYGTFGHVPLIIQNQTPMEQAQIDYAAKVQLHYARSLTQLWESVAIIPDASLELGDLTLCRAGGLRSQQVITGFNYPLRENAPMPLTLRAYVPLVGV